jgi:hypothetical protein
LFLLATLAGCVHVDQTLTLNADGSGEFKVRYAMQKQDIDHMEAVSRQAMALEGVTNNAESHSPFDFNEDDIRRDFLAYESEGVTLKSARITEEAGWKNVDLDIRFASLAGLVKTDFLSDRSIRLTRREDGRYELVQAAPTQGLKPSDMAGLDEGSIKSLMAEMMKGFRARMEIRTPGDIVETSADRHEARAAVWEFDLDKDPKALDRAQSTDLRIVFEGQGLDLKEIQGEGSGS